MSINYLYLLNSFFCIYFLTRYKNEAYSLHKMINIFILVFFVAANWLQNLAGRNVTSLFGYFSADAYYDFQLQTLLIIMLYNIIYYFFRNKYDTYYTFSDEDLYIPNSKRLIILATISFLITLFIHRNSILLLFFRGLEGVSGVGTGNNSLNLIYGKFIRPIPLVCYLLAKINYANKKVQLYLFLLTLFSLFPSSLARNAVAMFWLPVVLLNFSIFSRKYVFIFLMLFSVFILMPLFDSFRSYDGEIFINPDLDYLVSMHFDASQMFMSIQEREIITYGSQLLGVLFFYVPRSMWPDKPIGSGAFVADMEDAFENVSMPYFAEGYINFGYLGILLFLIVLSIFTAMLDSKYWISKENGISTSVMGVYLFLIGAIFFIMRGDLMSSTAYTVGSIFCYFFTMKMTKGHISIES